MEDMGVKLGLQKFAGKKGIGTEHMIVALIDRVKFLLDKYPDHSAIIASGIDWSSPVFRGGGARGERGGARGFPQR